MSKVMLVEDDANLLEIYQARLAAEGFQIVTAKDGEEALAIAVKERPDLIIADIMMPKVSGYDVLDILRNTPETANIKVIMLTALGQDGDKEKADKLGADDYITKPFDSDVLLSKIKAVLKRNQELQEKQHAQIEFVVGAYQFNSKLRTLKHGNDVSTLSPKENELLLMLCEYKNDLLPRETALKRIWGSDTYFNGRSMDVYIAKLRKYLKEDEKIEIVNIHGNGFRLVVN